MCFQRNVVCGKHNSWDDTVSRRRMGHWRLTFQYAFADALGYRYIWQMDDDSHFNATVSFNVVSICCTVACLKARHQQSTVDARYAAAASRKIRSIYFGTYATFCASRIRAL